ncbi:hypothetical protein GC105_04850 [Alkalibaculum sp. M08DMB]|uniref:Transcriptional regulator n=1 Tax=Alkalibaculum sporogenes TaxID=2655001 RepID=A0A6A7K6Q7_9FIRM|nr:transcriptional regulator GutM [Alkalibaculum sporogenes]MPW25116.1 hypothetical protein [Alkalibaculum sporogenes]
MMLRLGIIFVCMFILQGILTFFQVKNYRTNVSELNKKGSLFVGQTKGKIRAGSIVIMAIGSDGNIIEARAMTGITVFHRFKTITELTNENIYKSELWIKNIKNKQMAKAIKVGIEAIESKLEVEDDNSRD